MPSTTRATVYIDVDDEITSVIDKVKSTDSKVVALVLPKRATVLQSMVNMKLLKRTAENDKKSIVLITSEASLLSVAGLVGVYVAKTLQSKPEIPALASAATGDDVEDVHIDPSKPVGELAEDEAIEVDNDAPAIEAVDMAKTKGLKKGKIKIPDFDKFRVLVIVGVIGLVGLIAGLYWATQVAPRATITIKTDTNTIDSELQLTVDPKLTELGEATDVVPGTLKETKKTDTESVPATGEVDKGTKAKGKVTLQNCSPSVDDVTIPAGTGVSNGNLTFFTDKAVVLPATVKNGLNQCITPTKDVEVTAQNGGDRYNISGDRTFTVAGYSSVKGVDSTAMAGGTSSIVKVVSQKDIDEAKQKITDRSDAARDEMLSDMEAFGLIGLRETFATKGEPVVTTSPGVNEEATEVKVSYSVTYTMLGIKKADLKTLVEKNVDSKIDKSTQVILDDGLDEATIILTEKKANGEVKVTIKTKVLAGPQLDDNAIKQSVLGKKKGQAISIIKARPGIKEVDIKYSPFWVSSNPKKAAKITIIFEQNNTNNASQ